MLASLQMVMTLNRVFLLVDAKRYVEISRLLLLFGIFFPDLFWQQFSSFGKSSRMRQMDGCFIDISTLSFLKCFDTVGRGFGEQKLLPFWQSSVLSGLAQPAAAPEKASQWMC